jgi:F0F1-type ATP synthase membrane subunit b/b'
MKMKISEEMGAARASLQYQAQNLSREIAKKILGRGLE